MIKISILGDIVLDQYIKHGKIKENYGGIIYMLSALSVLFNKEAQLFSVSIVNVKHYDSIIS